MRVLILGASGMLGSAAYKVFGEAEQFEVIGALRSPAARRALPEDGRRRLRIGVDVENFDSVIRAFADVRPDLVLNCIGVIKQLDSGKDPLAAIPLNALLPHRLAALCRACGARLIHVSTDCVFTGRKGMYQEQDAPDAEDLYGRSKLLGEAAGPEAVTLRTSIIGEELFGGANGLVGWFLSQRGSVKGFRRAIFSGFPTVTLARIMRDVLAPRPELSGLFHVSSAPINKYELLGLVARAYERDIEIVPDDALVIDRSLDSKRFQAASGFAPPPWPALVEEMRAASPFWARN